MDYATKHEISVYLTEEQLNKRIAEIGADITKRFEGESVYLVCILKGSIFFTTELAKRIELPMTIDFMSVSSYGGATKSSGVVNVKTDLSHSIEGENVIIVEDIIDTGNTLNIVKKLLLDRGAKSVKIVTLLDKYECRKVEIEGDYVGFKMPDVFAIGFGLDCNEKYRNLPYVGALKEECYM